MARKKRKTKKKATAPAQPESSDVRSLATPASEDTPVTAVQAEIVEDERLESDESELREEYSHLPSAVTDGLTTYLREISRYPLLTKEQELEIAKRYRETGNPKDAEILVTSNLRFVVKVAAEYARFGARLIDLIQEGNVGLMHAVREFNPYKDVRLITYAVWWIRGYIQEYLMRQYSMVRIGTTQNQRKLFYRLEKEKEQLDREGFTPTVKLLSDRLGVSEADVRTMEQRMSGRDVSLDQPLDADSSTTRIDLEADESESIEDTLEHMQALEILKDNIETLKSELNERELYLLNERILSDEPKKLQEIGDEWGVTREAVRQMESRVIRKIRESFQQSIR